MMMMAGFKTMSSSLTSVNVTAGRRGIRRRGMDVQAAASLPQRTVMCRLISRLGLERRLITMNFDGASLMLSSRLARKLFPMMCSVIQHRVLVLVGHLNPPLRARLVECSLGQPWIISLSHSQRRVNCTRVPTVVNEPSNIAILVLSWAVEKSLCADGRANVDASTTTPWASRFGMHHTKCLACM